jgi:hypothetical protein
MIDRWLTRWSRNYAFLRRTLDGVGRELARKPYDSLLQPGEPLSFSQLVEGVRVDFDVDVFRIDPDGTLWVSIETQARLPTPFDIKPSLVFRKRPDGSAWIQL